MRVNIRARVKKIDQTYLQRFKKGAKWLSPVLALLFLYAAYSKVNIERIAESYKSVDIMWIISGFILIIPRLIARGHVLSIVCGNDSKGTKHAIRVVMLSYLSELLITSKGAILVKAYQLNKLSTGIVHTGYRLIADKLSVACCHFLVIAAAVVSAYYLGERFIYDLELLGIMSLTTIISCVVFFWVVRKESIKWVRLVFFSSVVMVLNFFQLFLFLNALGLISIDLKLMLLGAVSVTVGLFPVGVHGIGARDFALVAFLGSIVSVELAVILGLIYVVESILKSLIGLPLLLAPFRHILLKVIKRDG